MTAAWRRHLCQTCGDLIPAHQETYLVDDPEVSPVIVVCRSCARLDEAVEETLRERP